MFRWQTVLSVIHEKQQQVRTEEEDDEDGRTLLAHPRHKWRWGILYCVSFSGPSSINSWIVCSGRIFGQKFNIMSSFSTWQFNAVVLAWPSGQRQRTVRRNSADSFVLRWFASSLPSFWCPDNITNTIELFTCSWVLYQHLLGYNHERTIHYDGPGRLGRMFRADQRYDREICCVSEGRSVGRPFELLTSFGSFTSYSWLLCVNDRLPVLASIPLMMFGWISCHLIARYYRYRWFLLLG